MYVVFVCALYVLFEQFSLSRQHFPRICNIIVVWVWEVNGVKAPMALYASKAEKVAGKKSVEDRCIGNIIDL